MHLNLIRLLQMALLLALSTAFLAACGDDDDTGGMNDSMNMGMAPAGSIQVDLTNWAVSPAQPSAKAGKVTFWAVHEMAHAHNSGVGGATHDLQVMRKEADGSYELVGQVQGLKMGEARALTLTLAPGDYELACNVVEEVSGQTIAHYANGMHTAFTVA